MSKQPKIGKQSNRQLQTLSFQDGVTNSSQNRSTNPKSSFKKPINTITKSDSPKRTTSNTSRRYISTSSISEESEEKRPKKKRKTSESVNIEELFLKSILKSKPKSKPKAKKELASTDEPKVKKTRTKSVQDPLTTLEEKETKVKKTRERKTKPSLNLEFEKNSEEPEIGKKRKRETRKNHDKEDKEEDKEDKEGDEEEESDEEKRTRLVEGIETEMIGKLSEEMSLKENQIKNTLLLLFKEQATIAFITRYRKEQTGSLNEEQITDIQKRYEALVSLEHRKKTVISQIQKQGKLTDELLKLIKEATRLYQVEDLYLPFKPKKKTRAQKAIEAGLLPLAELIISERQKGERFLNAFTSYDNQKNISPLSSSYLNPDHLITTEEEVLIGVKDILCEKISHSHELREWLRNSIIKHGKISISKHSTLPKTGKAASRHNIYDFWVDKFIFLSNPPAHAVLAVSRGEKEHILKTKLEWNTTSPSTRVRQILQILNWIPLQNNTHTTTTTTTTTPTSNVVGSKNKEKRFGGDNIDNLLSECIRESIEKTMLVSLLKERRKQLFHEAEAISISVFSKNLKPLLMGRPVHGKRILAIDPGYRTGCKMAILDQYSDYVTKDIIFIEGDKGKNMEKIDKLVKLHQIDLICIGNGATSRLCEELVSEYINSLKDTNLKYTIIHEAGASVYSASPLAGKELPSVEASYRGAVSIGRRLQDPLSEFVKIPPQALGVGMYQHDVNQKELEIALNQSVTSCVSSVGVNLNTASITLLKYVSGLNESLAKSIVNYRSEKAKEIDENNRIEQQQQQQQQPFTNRNQLLEIKGLGKKTFQQAAGFLKITNGDNFFDNTQIHPESYSISEKFLKTLKIKLKDLTKDKSVVESMRKKVEEFEMGELKTNGQSICQELGTDLPTLSLIVENLKKPGLDPRDEVPEPILRTQIRNFEDLKVDQEVEVIVTNVTPFGAFCDLGLPENGLLRPGQELIPGERITAVIKSLQCDTRRISLEKAKN